MRKNFKFSAKFKKGKMKKKFKRFTEVSYNEQNILEDIIDCAIDDLNKSRNNEE